LVVIVFQFSINEREEGTTNDNRLEAYDGRWHFINSDNLQKLLIKGNTMKKVKKDNLKNIFEKALVIAKDLPIITSDKAFSLDKAFEFCCTISDVINYITNAGNKDNISPEMIEWEKAFTEYFNDNPPSWAREDNILKPGHELWQEFVNRLAGPEGCDFNSKRKGVCCGDLVFTKYILRKHFPGLNHEKTIEFFKEHGGHCDCEVLYNVDGNAGKIIKEKLGLE